MPISLGDWADRLENQPLPAMALTIQRVARLVDRPSTTYADYQRVIGKDPGFALAIFRGFEKASHTPTEPTGNLAHAIALLGIAPLIEGTRSLPVLKMPAEPSWQRLCDCYSRAGHAAWYAYHWGLARKDTNREEMAIAALLHDCGEMSLWTHARREMEQIEHHSKQGLSREKAALKVLGFSLDQLSQTLSERWRLPPLVAGALKNSGAFESRSLGVMLASALARASAADWRSEESWDLIELAAEYQQLTVDRSMARVHSLAAGAARALTGLPLPTTAVALVQQSPLEQRTRSLETVIPHSLTPVPKEKRTDVSPPPAPSKSDPRRQKPRTATNRLQETLGRIMGEVQENVGMDRAMFAMLTPDRKALRPRFLLGADQTSPLRGFQLSLDKPHLFSRLMAKPQGFWLHPENQEKYLPMIPASLRNSVNTDGFFISSLFVRKQPLGLLYGDCNDASLLTSERFNLFKLLSQQLSNELGQGRG